MIPDEILRAIGVAQVMAAKAKQLHVKSLAAWRNCKSAEDAWVTEHEYRMELAGAIAAREQALILFKRWTWGFLEVVE